MEISASLLFAQLRAKPVLELVKCIVDFMATRLDEASQLKVGTSEVFTPFAENCFTTEHSWSRQYVNYHANVHWQDRKILLCSWRGRADLNDIPHG